MDNPTADADLIGYPFQVVVGKRGVAAGVVELKDRATGERSEVAIDALAQTLTARIVGERARYR